MQPERWMSFHGGKWHEEPIQTAIPATRFSDIKYYLSNIVDYFRILLCFAGAVAITFHQPVLAAVLLFISTLLDWIDGPIARARNQCTIFGSGIDWLADVLAQVVTLFWWASLMPALIPVLSLALAIELTNCIFDFATTATGRYPVMEKRQKGFKVILEWTMPEGSYTWFGTFLWLACPVFCLIVCVDLSWTERTTLTADILQITEAVLVLPAALYLWCEAAYAVFIFGKWSEAPRSERPNQYSDDPAGFALLGILAKEKRDLLDDCLASVKENLQHEWSAKVANHEIFWINLWQRGDTSISVDARRKPEIDRWCDEIAKTAFPGEAIVRDGFGFIINPVGSKMQPWHIDYAMDYATVFIPLTRLTAENSVQYIWMPPQARRELGDNITKNPDIVDMNALADACGSLSIRQLIAQPYSLIRMNFGAIHRGVANTGDFERIMFFVSVVRGDAKIPIEPAVVTIDMPS